MNNKTVRNRSMQRSLDTILQNVLDLLEADDGKTFEEKKKLAIQMLTEKEDALLASKLVDMAFAEKSAAQIRESFWNFGEEIPASNEIILRKVRESDRDDFLALQKNYSSTPAMLAHEAYQNMVWSEHTEQKSLMLAIEQDHTYVGYCGIQDLSKPLWEISIELQPEKIRQGIGSAAIPAMLDALRERLGVTEYRIRIEPTNHASQRLFEKLGAVPNGISELWLHDPEELAQLEKESMHLVDDALISVAEKFSVESRVLLSHVLEYRLTWRGDKMRIL